MGKKKQNGNKETGEINQNEIDLSRNENNVDEVCLETEISGDEENESKTPEKQDENDLSMRIKEEEERAEALLNDLKRLKADFENYKKRMIKEQTGFLRMASCGLITKLLPVVDNLERAISAAESHKDEKTIKEGIEMVYTQFLGILEKEGLEEINPIGGKFDPELHEAVMQEESEDYSEDTIVEVLQKGYRFNDKVLRPAMVKVSK